MNLLKQCHQLIHSLFNTIKIKEALRNSHSYETLKMKYRIEFVCFVNDNRSIQKYLSKSDICPQKREKNTDFIDFDE